MLKLDLIEMLNSRPKTPTEDMILIFEKKNWISCNTDLPELLLSSCCAVSKIMFFERLYPDMCLYKV